MVSNGPGRINQAFSVRSSTWPKSQLRADWAIFHGKRGELRQRYREGQEDQLGALGLVVNLVVLWNTIYIDAAVSQLRAEGHVILDEDVARLSPLGSRHINMLGRYAFTIPDIVARGELRPLRDPGATGIDDA